MEPQPRGKDAAGERTRSGDLKLGASIARRSPRPDRRSLIGSAVFHVLLLGSLAFTTVIKSPEPEYEAFRVKIISPPPQVQGEPAPEPPRREQPKIVAPREVKPVETRKRETVVNRPPETTTPAKEEEAPPKKEEPKPVAGNNPDPSSPGGEGLNVDIAGQEFPYPEYLENIVRQMYRYFRWDGAGRPTARVTFCINRDGTVSGLRLAERSSDWDFNTKVMMAVENAGKRAAFGPLPDGWLQDRLCVNFGFIPQGG